MHAQPFFRIGHIFWAQTQFGRNNFWAKVKVIFLSLKFTATIVIQ